MRPMATQRDAERAHRTGPARDDQSPFDPADRMFAVDARHRITFWNAASERFLDIPARQALGSPCYRILRGCDSSGQTVCGPGCCIAQLANGGAAPNRFTLTVRDGGGCRHSVWVSIVLTPSAHHGLWSVLHVLHAPAASAIRGGAQSQPSGSDDPHIATELAAAAPSGLTEREAEILKMLAAGLSATTIAERLYISGVTVRNHVQHILAKLKVHSKTAAVAYAYRHRLIQSLHDAAPGRGEHHDEKDSRRHTRPDVRGVEDVPRTYAAR